MKCFISFERLVPDTVNGEILVLKHVYTSFDKESMDALEESFRNQYGDGSLAEFEYKSKTRSDKNA